MIVNGAMRFWESPMQWSFPNRWKIVGRTYLKGLFDFVAGLLCIHYCKHYTGGKSSDYYAVGGSISL